MPGPGILSHAFITITLSLMTWQLIPWPFCREKKISDGLVIQTQPLPSPWQRYCSLLSLPVGQVAPPVSCSATVNYLVLQPHSLSPAPNCGPREQSTLPQPSGVPTGIFHLCDPWGQHMARFGKWARICLPRAEAV